MTDTQPTKFCKDCAFCKRRDGGRDCDHESNFYRFHLVTGRRIRKEPCASWARSFVCKGTYWTPRPSIFQRIKRWFG